MVRLPILSFVFLYVAFLFGLPSFARLPFPALPSSLPSPTRHCDHAAGPSNSIVLHENKRYYRTAEETYGEDVETMVQEEDAQLLSEPIVAPIKVRKYNLVEKDMPVTRFDKGSVLVLPLLSVWSGWEGPFGDG
jgi:hypothetical protein